MKIKQSEGNPYICVGGDLNHVSLDAVADMNPDLRVVPSPPSRGNARLDVAMTNFTDEISRVTAATSLHTTSGIPSDHKIVTFDARLQHVHRFEWIKYRTRVVTEDGKEKFTRFMTGVDWIKALSETTCPTKSVEVMQEKIGTLRYMLPVEGKKSQIN